MATVLCMPDPVVQSLVKVDASDITPHERNYDVGDQELLAVTEDLAGKETLAQGGLSRWTIKTWLIFNKPSA